MSISTMSRLEVHRAFEQMAAHGGGFCSKLAAAWFVADAGNRARIESTFAHLVEQFSS